MRGRFPTDGAIGQRLISHIIINSVSEQGEPNPVLWLATRAGQMELSCPLGITRCVLQEKFCRMRRPFNKIFFRNLCREIFFVTVIDFLWSLYQWNWKTRKLNVYMSTRMKTKTNKQTKCCRVSWIYFATSLSKNTKWHEGMEAVFFPRKRE